MEGAAASPVSYLQDEIYRIAREALRNAFHHAQASRIEVEIAYDHQLFRLRIRDDGKGIDPAVLEEGARQGHWGLPGHPGTRETDRGAVGFWSELGAGTEVELMSRFRRLDIWLSQKLAGKA